MHTADDLSDAIIGTISEEILFPRMARLADELRAILKHKNVGSVVGVTIMLGMVQDAYEDASLGDRARILAMIDAMVDSIMHRGKEID